MLNIGKTKRIHFIGIGGIGMSGMAELLASSGYIITGSDLESNDRVEFLSSINIDINIGHSKKNIDNADLVVFSSAVDMDNIEIKEAKSNGIPVMRRAEMLAELVRLKPISIGVSGTHGKTTSCSMVGSILHYAKKDPTIVVGGIVKSFNTNAVSGSGDIIVVEADEYDKTFLSLSPTISIVNNIEEEHLDCYDNLDDLKQSFIDFSMNIPFYGLSIMNIDNENVASIAKDINRPIIKYSIYNDSDYSAKNIKYLNNTTNFNLYVKGDRVDNITLKIPGEHNVYNSLCAISVCLELGIKLKFIKKALKEFHGVKRRFDIKFQNENYIYIDDYAHHPTEIDVTLNAIKSGWEEKKFTAIFQPHLYSRTKEFYKDFAKALFKSDEIILMEIYGARERPIKGVSSKIILDELIKMGHSNCCIAKGPNVVDSIKNDNQIIITMGAGNIWSQSDGIIKYLSQ